VTYKVSLEFCLKVHMNEEIGKKRDFEIPDRILKNEVKMKKFELCSK